MHCVAAALEIPPGHVLPHHPPQRSTAAGQGSGFQSWGWEGFWQARNSGPPQFLQPPSLIDLPFLLRRFVCACLRAAKEKLRLASKQQDCAQPVSEGWPPQTPCTSRGNLHVFSCQESVACTDSPQSHLDTGPASTTLLKLSALI